MRIRTRRGFAAAALIVTGALALASCGGSSFNGNTPGQRDGPGVAVDPHRVQR
jgi:hypothetical protein